jgi:hypothetical protein
MMRMDTEVVDDQPFICMLLRARREHELLQFTLQLSKHLQPHPKAEGALVAAFRHSM